MRKGLAIFAVATFVAVVPLASQPNQATRQKQETTKQSQPSPVASTPEKHDSRDHDKGEPSGDPPNWYASFENPDGMLVIVGLITCFVIGWQSMETRRAAKGAQRAADASFAQIQMTKAKERARLEIKGSKMGMGVLKRSDDSWWIRGNLEFRNTGISKAYIIRTGGGIAIADNDKWPLPDDGESILDWPDSVIEPSRSNLVSSMREHSGTRDEFAVAV